MSSPEHEKIGSPQNEVLWEKEAVELGLIDRIGGLSDALEQLHQMIADRKTGTEKGN